MSKLIRFVTLYAKFEIVAGLVLVATIAGYALITANQQNDLRQPQAPPALQQ